LRTPDGTIHFEVTAHKDEEGNAVDEHKKHNVHQAGRTCRRLKREAYGKLAVIRDTEEGQKCHGESKTPATSHDVACVFQGQAFVEVHGVRDGVVTLQGDHCQRVN
jgi:hypothetical protein